MSTAPLTTSNFCDVDQDAYFSIAHFLNNNEKIDYNTFS